VVDIEKKTYDVKIHAGLTIILKYSSGFLNKDKKQTNKFFY